MKASAMDRMRRVLSAIKMNEMVQLGAKMRQVEAARQEARDLRETGRSLAPAETPTEMILQGQWQASLESRARAAEARAQLVMQEAAPLSAQLARTLGQEDVTLKLINDAKRQTVRLQEARAEEDAI